MVDVEFDRALTVFGLQEPVDEKTVVETYRQLAQLYHPDRLAGSSPTVRAVAERQMTMLNAARDTILDALRCANAYTRPEEQGHPQTERLPAVRFLSPQVQPKRSFSAQSGLVLEVDADLPSTLRRVAAICRTEHWRMRRGSPLVSDRYELTCRTGRFVDSFPATLRLVRISPTTTRVTIYGLAPRTALAAYDLLYRRQAELT